MNYIVDMQVGYYEDDDTYHGPFRSGSRLEADSINEALRKANELLRNRKSELNEPEDMTDGVIFTIYNEIGELCFDHVLGILRTLCPYTDPPSELIVLNNRINAELIEYLKKHPDKMHDIRPRQFEELIAEILAHYGWEVQLTPPTKDGGYDIFAVSKDISGVRTSWIVECKKYKLERRVGVDTVRALYGASGALTRGNVAMMLATTSSFTTGAKRYAAGQYNFDLRDYRDVVEWINEYRPHPDGKLYIKDNMLVTL
jgi:HJR/Mrr/RecB family endonuclease